MMIMHEYNIIKWHDFPIYCRVETMEKIFKNIEENIYKNACNSIYFPIA